MNLNFNKKSVLDWPLMSNNIKRIDLDAVIKFLQQDDPMITQSSNVREFESEWSSWLGVQYSVFVNSGSSANLLSLSALKYTAGTGEIIVPSLTWVSDIASVIQTGFTPVFVDCDPRTLGMNSSEVLSKITDRTKAVFITHVLGFNAISQKLLDGLTSANIPLIEDVCESHGATFSGRKLGTIGILSNFSYYYAHHMSTIEGGMISTNDPNLYQILRMMRSHGMVREATSAEIKSGYQEQFPDLNPDFIFAYPAYNMRSTEINAVIGRSQLKCLDENNDIRFKNFKLFLDNLDPSKYRTDFDITGSSNYAFTLILQYPNDILCERVMNTLKQYNVEFRRGTSGGGNQLRQPYLQDIVPKESYKNYPNTEHVHFYGFYIGNYPSLDIDKIKILCDILNAIPSE
ncbi:MAG: CDP-4-keto-6-deoxy-D-glucose-3-dehydrase [Chloroflexi bacterium]|nr:CDP-4-keto-6-deoxy-D-glucose-3-dehydrase [Chloroflexota bacterium]